MLNGWIKQARQQGASDLHVEAGMPLAMRMNGDLHTVGEPVPGAVVLEAARQVVGPSWSEFVERRSFDASRVLQGVQCRINVMATSHGLGMAIRLLAGYQPTVNDLNLHPDIAKLALPAHGLVLVCGPTGSGKTTTLAALVEQVNRGRPKHVVTIENPIEYHLRPRRAFIRQREVGRDTPSFEQALLDALREDPDVLMVGEMRRPRTIQLTIDAAETGHLVLATMHSSSATEALQRIVAAFPSDAQDSVRSQLADCLLAVLNQRLVYREDAGLRVPECELLMVNDAVRHAIRGGKFFKLTTAMETGAGDGMWTFERYRRWLDAKRNWRSLDDLAGPDNTPPVEADVALPQMGARTPAAGRPVPSPSYATPTVATPASTTPVVTPAVEEPGEPVHVIDDTDTGTMQQLLDELAGA